MSDVDVGTLVATLRAEDAELVASFARAQQLANQFDGSMVTAQVAADISQLTSGVGQAQSQIQAVNGQTATAQITADAGQADSAVAGVQSALQAVDGQTATAQLTADPGQAQAAISQAQSDGRSFAGSDFTANISGDIGELLEKIKKGREALDEGLGKAAGLAVGAALGASLAAAINMEPARKRIAAQLRLTPDEQKSVNDAASNLFKNNWSEDIGGANEVISSVISSFKDLRSSSSEDLAAIGTKAAATADLMGVEIGKAARTAGQLVRSGLAKDATEAFDLIVAASQNTSAEMQDDLLEVTSEYTPAFAQLGLTGSQALDLISTASADGAIQMDKIGDALKEFTIRATDMSTSSVAAYQTLGLEPQKLSNEILAGGETANAAFQQIVQGLDSIKDPATKANTAIALFGTPIEDLGTQNIPRFLSQLANVGTGLGDVTGRADEAASTFGTTAAGGFESFWHQVQLSAEELGQNLLPAVTTITAGLATFLSGVVDVVTWIGNLPGPIQAFALALGAVAIAKAAGLFSAIGTAVVSMQSKMAAAAATAAATGSSFSRIGTIAGGALGGIKKFGAGLLGAVGGPGGLLIAGAITAVTLGLSAISERSAAAKAAADAYKQSTSDLADALRDSNGVLDENVQKMVLQRVEQAGGAKLAADLGISLGTLVSAQLGNAEAQDTARVAYEKWRDANVHGQGIFDETTQKNLDYASTMVTLGIGLKDATELERARQEALAQAAKATQDSAQATAETNREATRGLHDYTAEAAAAGEATRENAAAARDSVGDLTGYRDAIQGAADASEFSSGADARHAAALAGVVIRQDAANAAYDEAKTAAEEAAAALTPFEQGSKDAADAQSDLAKQVDEVTDALDRQAGLVPTLEEANAKASAVGDDLADSFKVGTKEVEKLGSAILDADGKVNTSTDSGRRLRQGILDTREAMVAQAAAARDAALAQGDDLATATGKATAAQADSERQLISTLTAVGLTDAEARKLIATYGAVPTEVSTQLNARDDASAHIAEVRRKAEALAQQKYAATLSIDTSAFDAGVARSLAKLTNLGQTSTRTNGPTQFKAAGGAIFGPGSSTSDDIPAMLSNDEHVWTAREVAAIGGHPAMYRMRKAALSGQLKGYATGGTPSAFSLAGNAPRSAGARESISRGAIDQLLDAFADLMSTASQAADKLKAADAALAQSNEALDNARHARDADNAAARADVREAEAARAVLVRQRRNAQAVQERANAKADATSLQLSRTSDAKKRADLQKRLATEVKDAQNAARDVTKAKAAENKSTRDVAAAERGLAAARAKGAADVRSAVVERNADAARAKGAAARKRAADDLVAEQRRDLQRTTQARKLLVSVAAATDQLSDRLKNATDKLNSARADKAALASNLAGGLSGVANNLLNGNGQRASGSDVLRGLQFRQNELKGFGDNLAALQRGGLSATLLQQLTEGGVDGAGATAAALAKSSPTLLRQINATVAATDKLSAQIGGRVAGAVKDPGIASLVKEVGGLAKNLGNLKDLGATLAKAVRGEFTTIGGSKDLAMIVRQGEAELRRTGR